MPKVNQFVEEAFTNKFGQVIQPGDKVAYSTLSTGRVDLRVAWFGGVFKNEQGQVVSTRVKGVHNRKYVPTGKMVEYTHNYFDYSSRTYKERIETYPEYMFVDCEPHGTKCLYNNMIIPIKV